MCAISHYLETALTVLPTAMPHITRAHRTLLLLAAVMICLLVTLGGIVCATESGTGCPDWPGCYGRIIPPPQINAIIEYTHRLVAGLTTPLVLAAAIVSWRRARAIRWVSRTLAVSVLFVLAVIVFGAFAVLTGLPPVIAAIDLGSALIALALVVTAAVVAWVRHTRPDLPDHLSARAPLARLSWAAMGAVWAVYVSGVLVAGKGSLTRCLGWPMWVILPADRPGWPQMARLGLAALAALLIVVLVVRVWRWEHRGKGARRAAAWLGAAFLAELAITVLLLTAGTSPLLLVLHVAAAVGVWALLVVVAVRASVEPDSA